LEFKELKIKLEQKITLALICFLILQFPIETQKNKERKKNGFDKKNKNHKNTATKNLEIPKNNKIFKYFLKNKFAKFWIVFASILIDHKVFYQFLFLLQKYHKIYKYFHNDSFVL
jgi:hypothetical protein